MSRQGLLYSLRRMLEQIGISYDKTRAQYMKHLKHFAEYCKEKHRCRKPSECKPYVQEYADYLAAEGKSASTIHTYLAPVCKVFRIPMEAIRKPRRATAENTRSRGTPAVDRRSDTKRSASPRLWDFEKRVGIRRAECAKLKGKNFKQDESGYWCVEVEKGKGGKYQLQRIAEADVEFVRSYFTAVGPEDYVFSKGELKNKIDLHHLRGENAKAKYRAYVALFRADPAARQRVYEEIQARWEKYNPRQPCPKYGALTVPYYIRGKNRELAKKNGWDTRYDRLALLAVSVFHLSHWRVDVTVANYILT